jgi:magnesium chelatase family protein
MGLALIRCRAEVALLAPEVGCEVHLGAGLPSFTLVGLAATEVKESRERVRAAIVNSGFEFPAGRVTVNLAPADLPKDGGRFDLAIALGILVASGQLQPRVDLDALEFIGELGLDGALRPVRGALPAAAASAAAGRRLVVPLANATEFAVVPGLAAAAAPSLVGLGLALSGAAGLEPVALAAAGAPSGAGPEPAEPAGAGLDEVCGQALAKRALLIAAAGGHSLLMVGPPGCGKTMLAQRLPRLLPPLEGQAALEAAMIASVAGAARTPAVPGRPFRAPHHTASAGAIVGGGSSARPGEVTLAHGGVLFLDELPEFDRRVLESLREPLESGHVAISRAGLQAEYPAGFQLVAAMNPCPCGYHGAAGGRCRCGAQAVQRYQARLSGPLLDRIDLQVALQPVGEPELAEHRRRRPAARAETARLVSRVACARERQLERQGCLNARLDSARLEADETGFSDDARVLLARARDALGLSLRGFHRVLRVARSIADLNGADDACSVPKEVTARHAAEAVQLRRGLAGSGGAGGS